MICIDIDFRFELMKIEREQKKKLQVKQYTITFQIIIMNLLLHLRLNPLFVEHFSLQKK